jgi:hypothetical protein
MAMLMVFDSKLWSNLLPTGAFVELTIAKQYLRESIALCLTFNLSDGIILTRRQKRGVVATWMVP